MEVLANTLLATILQYVSVTNQHAVNVSFQGDVSYISIELEGRRLQSRSFCRSVTHFYVSQFSLDFLQSTHELKCKNLIPLLMDTF